MIVFTSIYFESYCKTLAWYNKKILKSFYHKIHLHVKGILNQNKQPAHEDLGQCLKRHHHRNAKFSCCPAEQKQVKDKNLYVFWWWCHYLHVHGAMWLFVTNFWYKIKNVSRLDLDGCFAMIYLWATMVKKINHANQTPNDCLSKSIKPFWHYVKPFWIIQDSVKARFTFVTTYRKGSTLNIN